MAAFTPRNFRSSTGADFMIGSVGGSALPVDADPNTTPPDETRVVYFPKAKRSMRLDLSNLIIVADAACQIEYWYYINEVSKWVKTSAGTVNLTALTPAQPTIVPIWSLPMFFRVSTNSGGAKWVVGHFYR